MMQSIQRHAIPLLAGVLLALLLGYWINLIASHDRLRSEAIQNAHRHTQRQADAMAEQLDAVFGSLGGALMRIRERYLDQGIPGLDATARSVIGNFAPGKILQVSLIDARGYLAYSSLGHFEKVFLGDREHFKAHIDAIGDATFISTPVLGRTSRRWSVQFSRAVWQHGRLLGVLVISVDPAYLAETLASLQFHPDDHLALVASDGTILAHVPSHEKSMGKRVSAERPYVGPSAPTRGGFRATPPVEGDSRVFSWTLLPRQKHVVVVGMSEKSALHIEEAFIARSLRDSFIGSVAYLLATLATLLLYARNRRHEQAVMESNARVRAIIDNSLDAIISLDARYRVILVNQAAEAMFGHPAERIIGHTLDGLIPERYRTIHTEHIGGFSKEAFVARPMGKTNQVVGLRADETEFPIEVSISKTLLDGKLIFTAIVRDLSALRHAEAELREAEGRWRFALEGSNQGVWDWNIRSGQVMYSARWKAIVGHAENEIGNTSSEWEERLHPEDRERALAAVQAHIDGKIPAFNVEHRLRHKDGRYVWTLGRGMIVSRDAEGRPLRMVGTSEDITRQKALSQKLADEVRRTRDIIMSAREGIIVYGPDLRYQVWNPTMEIITGWREAEVLGRHPLEIFPFLEEGGVIERLQRALAGESPEPVEFPYAVARSGLSGWASEQCAPLRDGGGKIVGAIGTVHIITALKEAEVKLRRMNEELEARVAERTASLKEAVLSAESANRAKSTFLAKMSHEMRTPMTAIIGMADLMKRENRDARLTGRVEAIDTAAQHLLGIINDLLDLARIEAGKMTLNTSEVSPAVLIADSVALVQSRAEAKGLALRFDTGGIDALPELLIGDPQRLRQCLLNYLSNAVKFTARGQITVRVRADDRPAIDPARQRLRFEVSDTGIGIAPESLERLFESFEQVDNSITREQGGTGLGLAIVRQLAHLMGGEAGATSTEGRGSTFWFSCELARAACGKPATPGASPARPHEDPLTGTRILVVDDHQANIDVISAALDLVGITHDCVSDGESALRRMEASRYEIVLMDLHLPRMSGLETTAEIRRRFPERPPTILALTGDVPETVGAECERAGMNGVIGKPFQIDTLLAALRRAREASAAGEVLPFFCNAPIGRR